MSAVTCSAPLWARSENTPTPSWRRCSLVRPNYAGTRRGAASLTVMVHTLEPCWSFWDQNNCPLRTSRRFEFCSLIHTNQPDTEGGSETDAVTVLSHSNVLRTVCVFLQVHREAVYYNIKPLIKRLEETPQLFGELVGRQQFLSRVPHYKENIEVSEKSTTLHLHLICSVSRTPFNLGVSSDTQLFFCLILSN